VYLHKYIYISQESIMIYPNSITELYNMYSEEEKKLQIMEVEIDLNIEFSCSLSQAAHTDRYSFDASISSFHSYAVPYFFFFFKSAIYYMEYVDRLW